jgi:hypothetical protein
MARFIKTNGTTSMVIIRGFFITIKELIQYILLGLVHGRAQQIPFAKTIQSCYSCISMGEKH